IGSALLLSIVTVVFVAQPTDRTSIVDWIVPVFVGTAAWMSAGTLVSWADAVPWFLANAERFVVFLVTFALAVVAMRSTFRSSNLNEERSVATKLWIFLSVALLFALSF